VTWNSDAAAAAQLDGAFDKLVVPCVPDACSVNTTHAVFFALHAHRCSTNSYVFGSLKKKKSNAAHLLRDQLTDFIVFFLASQPSSGIIKAADSMPPHIYVAYVETEWNRMRKSDIPCMSALHMLLCDDVNQIPPSKCVKFKADERITFERITRGQLHVQRQDVWRSYGRLSVGHLFQHMYSKQNLCRFSKRRCQATQLL
jgi:hypothetical protein